jgi:hypothetical protein
MNDLLELAIEAHGGLDRWREVKSIEVALTISGALLRIKGFPERLETSVLIDADLPHTVMRPYGGAERRGDFRPDCVRIETDDGATIEERSSPRDAFAGHVRETKWDQLHRLYFRGYAMWNYVTTPFLLTKPGFELKELDPHAEDRETWRVLEVTYPPDVPTHCAVQKFYFSAEGMLKRIDYVTDVAGGVEPTTATIRRFSAGLCFRPEDASSAALPKDQVCPASPVSSSITIR